MFTFLIKTLLYFVCMFLQYRQVFFKIKGCLKTILFQKSIKNTRRWCMIFVDLISTEKCQRNSFIKSLKYYLYIFYSYSSRFANSKKGPHSTDYDRRCYLDKLWLIHSFPPRFRVPDLHAHRYRLRALCRRPDSRR